MGWVAIVTGQARPDGELTRHGQEGLIGLGITVESSRVESRLGEAAGIDCVAEGRGSACLAGVAG